MMMSRCWPPWNISKQLFYYDGSLHAKIAATIITGRRPNSPSIIPSGKPLILMICMRMVFMIILNLLNWAMAEELIIQIMKSERTYDEARRFKDGTYL